MIQIQKININDVREYDNNPRNNDDAVDVVAASIMEFAVVFCSSCISIRDTQYFDINVYSRIIELEIKTLSNDQEIRQATQKDIDLFLL